MKTISPILGKKSHDECLRCYEVSLVLRDGLEKF